MVAAGVLVVFDPRASSRRALECAAALAAPLTIVALAPPDERGSHCTFHGPELEMAVREAAARDLDAAREQLGVHAPDARFVLLPAGGARELAGWAAAGGFTRVLVGARRRLLGVRMREPLARALARAGIDVSLVD